MACTSVSITSASSRRLQGALLDLARLSKWVSSDPLSISADAPKLTAVLAQQLRAESSTFRSTDVVQIIGACCQLTQRHAPLLEAVAAHVMRGMPAYPLYALCNIPNGFARLTYRHQQLFDAIASFVTESPQADRLSPVDIASLVYAYAELRHSAGLMLEVCSQRLKACYLEVGGQNCATILNSYARLRECNPELFHVLSRAVLQTKSESFEVHHISVIMNAFAKCRIRKTQLMHLLGSYLEGRTDSLSPQNVANIVHACAKVSVYIHRLFFELRRRVVVEDLGAYKLFELTMLTHGLAKLGCGGSNIFERLYDELANRRNWEPKDVAQILDAMRRKQVSYHKTLTPLLLHHLLQNLCNYPVLALTQAAWNVVELDVLDVAGSVPSVAQSDENESMCTMRLILERMRELHSVGPLTPTERCQAQQLVRAFHQKYELEYNLQPHHIRAFCRSLFDVPTSVVSSVARPSRRQLV